jgi:ABC-type lipoprotein export system ATPase subunit
MRALVESIRGGGGRSGPSGSGKSTLLHLLRTLDAPTARSRSRAATSPRSASAALLRRERLEFVSRPFTSCRCSALENVGHPLWIAMSAGASVATCAAMLAAVGWRAAPPPPDAVGGERRGSRWRARWCTAGGGAGRQPTGNLDSVHAAEVVDCCR